MKFLNVEKPSLQQTDLNKFIDDLFNESKIELPDDIKCIKNLSSELPEIKIDQEQMQTLMENLVSNAINAMPDGGTITLQTSLASGLQLNHNTAQDYAVIEVMDTGTGISPELLEKLFQPYISNSYLGTGLGLTIVKKITEDHNGHIEVNSEEGVGTSLVIYLPVSFKQPDQK